jgi:hypothetical protein
MPKSDTSIGTKRTSAPWITKHPAAGGEIHHLLIRSSLASIWLAILHPRALITRSPLIPLRTLRRSNVHLNLLRGDRKVLHIHIPGLWRHNTAKQHGIVLARVFTNGREVLSVQGDILRRFREPLGAFFQRLVREWGAEISGDGSFGSVWQFVVVAMFGGVAVVGCREPEVPASLICSFPGAGEGVVDVLGIVLAHV